jgi:hypothetical protein
MTHHCHAHGCNRSVPPRMFACREHWFALSKEMQDAIWREYRSGQEVDKRPSLRYLAVQQLAEEDCMKKMPCVFERDFTDRRRPVLLERVTPGCEWVLEGHGQASVKYDGTACAVINGRLFARYDAKSGKAPPIGSIPCDPEPDSITGHWPHWQPVGDEPHFRWHREAWAALQPLCDGTYELCGPKLQGNPERLDRHTFLRHGVDDIYPPRSFDGLREFLREFAQEGIVFRDCERYAKIRRDDYGFPWPLERA